MDCAGAAEQGKRGAGGINHTGHNLKFAILRPTKYKQSSHWPGQSKKHSKFKVLYLPF